MTSARTVIHLVSSLVSRAPIRSLTLFRIQVNQIRPSCNARGVTRKPIESSDIGEYSFQLWRSETQKCSPRFLSCQFKLCRMSTSSLQCPQERLRQAPHLRWLRSVTQLVSGESPSSRRFESPFFRRNSFDIAGSLAILLIKVPFSRSVKVAQHAQRQSWSILDRLSRSSRRIRPSQTTRRLAYGCTVVDDRSLRYSSTSQINRIPIHRSGGRCCMRSRSRHRFRRIPSNSRFGFDTSAGSLSCGEETEMGSTTLSRTTSQSVSNGECCLSKRKRNIVWSISISNRKRKLRELSRPVETILLSQCD